MFIEITATERALIAKALELGDKKCDGIRDRLGELLLDDLAARALQGRISTVRESLGDLERNMFDWTFEQRRALGICLRLYAGKVSEAESAQMRLLIDTSTIDDRMTEVRDLLERLSGQESLFRSQLADDGSRMTVRFGEGEEIELTTEQMHRAADRVAAEGLAKV